MIMPNFLIIGAAKSGTSALYDFLSQHPQIYMSAAKEPMFFAFEGESPNFLGPGDDRSANYYSITDIKDYCALFQSVSDEVAIGEGSTLYLYHPKAPERIRTHIPDVKLIVILRDPVERAYSNFLHLVRDNREPLTDFYQAFQQEEIRMNNGWEWFWHYKRLGLYYVQLRRYFENFSQDQMRIYLYEDFANNSADLLKDCFQFLNVDKKFIPDMSMKVNASGVPKSKYLNSFLRRQNPIKKIIKPLLPEKVGRRLKTYVHNKNLVKPDFLPELREELIQTYFREDILKLQDLIQRDLSKWLI